MTDNLVYTSQSPKASHMLSPNRLVRVAAEFAGTAFITFAIYALSTWGTIINSNSILLVVGVGTALAYGVASLTFGRASGGHFNPAISFAGILTGVTNWLDGILYIVVQILGALAGAGVWYLLTPTSQQIQMSTWLTLGVNGFDSNNPASALLGQNTGLTFGIRAAVAVEIIFTIIVVAAFFATVRSNGSAHKNHSIAIAGAYGIGAMASFLLDGAGMNPARSTGIAIIGHFGSMKVDPLTQLWVFWVAPFVAAALVAFGFIIRDSVQAQRAETEAAVAALRLEQEAAALEEDDDIDSESVDENDDIDEQELPEVIIETDTINESSTDKDSQSKE
ncbi:glycerol transporter [Alloscardovia theropitheci]|uniref:Glycerol transporter n=1 Tax=Alloscardovia theropitheci TaxID=2496842 RepID=A0A4R0R104_9BIFI|nr:aquaporin [Alloscardovia theropitheci]TCD54786.1 glycerol transporter [Alloscardovia theropitheci]